MTNVVSRNNQTPQLNSEFSELIEKFEEMLLLGFSFEEIKNFFVKEDLTRLLMWYYQKSTSEGHSKTDLFTPYQEVNG